jgi:hypothetical protein
MKHLILCFVMFFVSSCYSEPTLTGYKYGGGTDNGKIETCNEQEIVNKWWNFHSYNSIVNALVPGYQDLCVLTGQNGIVFWNEAEGWGSYQSNWDWYCTNGDTMKVIDLDTDEVYWVKIFGRGSNGCYDMETTSSGITVRGTMCPCDDPFQE